MHPLPSLPPVSRHIIYIIRFLMEPQALPAQDASYDEDAGPSVRQQLSNLRDEIKNIHRREYQTYRNQEKVYEAFVQYSKPSQAGSWLVEKVNSLSTDIESLKRTIQKQNETIAAMKKERKIVSKG